MAAPVVTVLMPVHNGARFLGEAVDSVLRQTFGDFELLSINDGSSDETGRILASYRDPRMRVVDNERNLGLIPSLNKGFHLARGEFIARMDADDVCHPERLAAQVAFMRANPEVGVAGTWYWRIGAARSRPVRLPTSHEDICSWMPFHCPIAHPTVLMRRKALLGNDLHYDPSFRHAEDYDLWSRASRFTTLANLPRALLHYRTHLDQVTSMHEAVQLEKAKLVRGRELMRLIPDLSPADLNLHQQITTSTFERDPATLSQIEAWLVRLLRQNEEMGAYSSASFCRAVGKVWMSASLSCMPHAWAISRYSRSTITGRTGSRAVAIAGFSARALKRQLAAWARPSAQ